MHGFYLNERMMQICVEEAHRQAEIHRVQKLARTGRTSWLARQRCRVLSRFGQALVRCGRQLLRLVSQRPPGVQRPEGRRT